MLGGKAPEVLVRTTKTQADHEPHQDDHLVSLSRALAAARQAGAQSSVTDWPPAKRPSSLSHSGIGLRDANGCAS